MRNLWGAFSWKRAYACARFHAGERLRSGNRTFRTYVPTHLATSNWPTQRPKNRPQFQGRQAAGNPAAKSDTQQLGITLCFSFSGRQRVPQLGPQPEPAPPLKRCVSHALSPACSPPPLRTSTPTRISTRHWGAALGRKPHNGPVERCPSNRLRDVHAYGTRREDQ